MTRAAYIALWLFVLAFMGLGCWVAYRLATPLPWPL